MQILPVQNVNNYTQYKSPNFTSWQKTIYKTERGGNALENIKYTTSTWMFRNNPDWKSLTAFVEERYKNIPRVNVYDYACSNGSEAYTFLIAMFNDLGYEKTKKFLPIIAKDCDAGAIYKAKQNTIDLDSMEISDINEYTNGNFEDFFYSKHSDDMYKTRRWNVRSILTSNVNFSIADILADYRNIKPDNSIVFARNFWPYLSRSEKEQLAKGLYSQLGENATLITGLFDEEDPIHMIPIKKILVNAGFKPSKVRYVYEK